MEEVFDPKRRTGVSKPKKVGARGPEVSFCRKKLVKMGSENGKKLQTETEVDFSDRK